MPPKRDDEEDGRNGEKKTSPNQMQQQVERGKAPKEVKVIDGADSTGDAHIHFKGNKNIALYSDGTIRHGTIDDLRKVMTNDVKEWIIKNGWRLPSGL